VNTSGCWAVERQELDSDLDCTSTFNLYLLNRDRDEGKEGKELERGEPKYHSGDHEVGEEGEV